MNTNSSLSARIRGRNNAGFKGTGNHKNFTNGGGSYLDPVQNHKKEDYALAVKRKMHLSDVNVGRTYMTKKYYNNRQRYS